MRALDLFTGSGSVAKALRARGWEVDTLDINPAYAPTFCTDIRDFDFAALPADAYDFVWASPDCRTWSLAAGARHRKLGAALSPQAREADADVAALLSGLRHLRPRFGWVVENPRGHLRRHEPLQQLVQDVGGDRTTVFYSNYDYYTHKPRRLAGELQAQPVHARARLLERARPARLCRAHCIAAARLWPLGVARGSPVRFVRQINWVSRRPTILFERARWW